MPPIRDRVIVITGASNGIGAAVAERIGEASGKAVLVARREERLREVAARCGPNALSIVADVSRRDEVRRTVATTLDRSGRIDVWINTRAAASPGRYSIPPTRTSTR